MQWTRTAAKLEKEFSFENFSQALDFVVAVGEIAEEMGHHPDIHLINYSNVLIETTTHDEGNAVTDKDEQLAAAVDRLYADRG
ncbi:MAG: putative pterin-4-alpha-carbinolamine dehydratase [candidate division WS6 bacterium OLB20]|uniref:4a-hydroxytetrahydrobiopterin dehydratase n=1 Tax=candidate division WS6 bacterium OLB20 TaxID=1617426 RepID=A0A136M107_9BACT|nr:MAG: putative pterin-4-alpha-carbinolamine dehydratase [candidate division WS6 bacterium OLB20]